MDRTNLSAAAIAGMTVELRLIAFRYVSFTEAVSARFWAQADLKVLWQSIVTLLFFITYVIFQPPATVICKKVGPRWFLGAITFLWGCEDTTNTMCSRWRAS